MAIFINENKKIKSIFVNVNGERKPISSAWVDKDNIPVKIFQSSKSETDQYKTAPTGAYNNWEYTLDNSTITLNRYIGSETDVIVYANYPIGEKIYRTRISNNTSSLTYNIPYMFSGGVSYTNCQKIQSIKFSNNIDMYNVTDISYMFSCCHALISLDLGDNFDTSNVKDMNNMFSACYALTDLNLGNNFNTSNVTDMCQMFYSCYSLTSLDMNKFNTENVTNMAQMFDFCRTLTMLDLNSFDTGKVTNMYSMFSRCSNLKTIYVTNGKWSTSKANTEYMFTKCGTSSVTYR